MKPSGSGGEGPSILNVDTRWRLIVVKRSGRFNLEEGTVGSHVLGKVIYRQCKLWLRDESPFPFLLFSNSAEYGTT
jgi:hypothetical protein